MGKRCRTTGKPSCHLCRTQLRAFRPDRGGGHLMAHVEPRDGNRKFAVPRRSFAASRRAAKLRAEMFQARHHVVLQQLKRMLPGLRLVLVVEAEHQKRAEAA